MPINTIVFDLGGVLIDWNPRYVYRDLFTDEDAMNTFLSEICTPAWNSEQDKGRSLQEATDLLVSQHPSWETEIRVYYGRWADMLGGEIPGTVELLHMLHGGRQYRLFALTNWSAETFPIARSRFAFLDWFEGIVVSGEEKLAKPDPAIFQVLQDRYQVNPSETIFIDDSAPNVQAAEQLGFHSIHFVSPMQLREALADLL